MLPTCSLDDASCMSLGGGGRGGELLLLMRSNDIFGPCVSELRFTGGEGNEMSPLAIVSPVPEVTKGGGGGGEGDVYDCCRWNCDCCEIG